MFRNQSNYKLQILTFTKLIGVLFTVIH